ncbi:RNA-binding protein [Jiella sp. MQZ9-1]|uniref:RNA-binding protein n=1 Tax=Jiella flava TaxID=2816857 RepID=A0A939JW50_9HYPH|nr:RNA-binding protein [Jiella flava]MBO0661941.1 RNA-binding protein [Jiella flava]MCD2470731.1 RNA-binding protein [Jiella flava]
MRLSEGEWPADDGDGDELNPRSCIVTRQALDADALIRFVRDPNNRVVPDLKRRLPGRGAHVCFSRSAVEEAVKRRLFARAFKSAVETPDDLGAMVDALLVRQATGAMGLARKARQLVTGAAKVEAALRAGQALALVQAQDAAEDGLRKIDAARRAGQHETARPVPGFRLLSADEISLALGGWNVIHAAILAGDAGLAALKRFEALAKYRGEDPIQMIDGAGSGDASVES